MDTMKNWQGWHKRTLRVLLSSGVLFGMISCRIVPPAAIAQGQSTPGIQQGQQLPITAQAIINKQKIGLEVANTPEQQEIGLMFRTELAPNRGMVFPFDPPRPVAFWMKNTLIPLDILFLYKGQVRTIAANVPPCQQANCPTYASNGDIDQVMELKSGRAAELGIKVGDRILVKPLESKQNP